MLWRKPAAFAFVASSLMHALGHASMALAASALALSLSTAWGIQSGGASARLAGAWSSTLRGNSAADNAFLIAVAGLLVVAIKSGAGAYATYIQARAAAEVGCRLRLRLLDALLSRHRLRQPRHFDQRSDPAEAACAVVSLTERVRDVEAGLAWGLLGGLRAASQLAPLAVLLVCLSPRMAAVAAVVQVGFGWHLGRVRKSYGKATARAFKEHERLVEAADDCVRHADLWVTYGAEGRARRRIRALGDLLAEGAARLQVRTVGLSGANEMLGAAALVVAVAAQRWGALGSADRGPTLLAFAVPFFLAYRPLRELSDARLALARAQSAYGELKGVIDSAAPSLESLEPLPPRAWPLGVLEVRRLLLRRGACGPISMRVEPGTIAVILGPTAVGKTTLLRTLLGLDSPAGGEILFGGVALGDAPAGPSSRPFAWVPQDAPLLADTLAANVSLGAGDVHAVEALGPLGAAHLAESLRDARLGAGGRTVSGGERQWIALARAIATQQPVIVLDEPTSGLDADAQRVVLEAIAGLRGRRTVVLVTHRPEPIAIADAVFRLHPVERDPGFEHVGGAVTAAPAA